jgi:hypothetical protein
MPIFANVMLPAMCWTCASPDVVLIVSCPFVIIIVGRHVDCLLLSVFNQHGGCKDNTIILTNGQLTISTTSGEAHGWQHHIGENWHNRAPASGGEYSITIEDGRVRPKHVLIEFKK